MRHQRCVSGRARVNAPKATSLPAGELLDLGLERCRLLVLGRPLQQDVRGHHIVLVVVGLVQAVPLAHHGALEMSAITTVRAAPADAHLFQFMGPLLTSVGKLRPSVPIIRLSGIRWRRGGWPLDEGASKPRRKTRTTLRRAVARQGRENYQASRPSPFGPVDPVRRPTSWVAMAPSGFLLPDSCGKGVAS